MVRHLMSLGGAEFKRLHRKLPSDDNPPDLRRSLAREAEGEGVVGEEGSSRAPRIMVPPPKKLKPKKPSEKVAILDAGAQYGKVRPLL